MSTKDFNSATVTTAMTTAIVTTTTTTTTSATTFTSSPKVDAETEDEDEPPTTSDVDMDMVNGPNPWLPAYDFQRQHSSYFQQMQEDLQTNDTVLMQQMDFLETILEETSDDLQSDSDRSEPTYWVGAESEAENVIQILAKQQRSADARLDGSGSEWSSAISRTRCGQYSSASDRDRQIIDDDYPESPASSRSSISSRSNSLLQFESLERTCASLSPSSSSFDSLEYANRSHAARPENTSPDSLEQDYNPLSYDFVNSADNFSRIRPYRSFESLQTCQKEEGLFDYGGLSNGFTPLGTKRDMDQPKLRSRRHHRSRDFWHEIKEYGDDDDDNDDNEDDDDAVDPDEDLQISRDLQHEDRLPMFADSSCNYSTSLDYRNTIDLREIGIESKRDTLLDLKSGQTAVSNSFRSLNMRLIIPESTANGGNNDQHRHHYNNHHHHYYKHHQAQERQEFHERDQDELWRHQRQGWSNEERFNFRFTDKFQSAPSLPSSVTESAHDPCSLVSYGSSSRTTTFVSTSNLFENYTRVASVPVDLNLCGVYTTRDDTLGSQASLKENLHEMAEVVSLQGTKRSEISKEIEETNQEGKEHSKNISKSFVKTQISPNAVSGGKMETSKVEAEDHSEKQSLKSAENNQVTSTVKTQDRRNCVFDIAMCMENDIDGVVDEAIKQLKREMEEVTSSGKNTMLPGVVKRTHSGKQQQPWKVKNNASYELAQQFEIDEKNVGSNKHRKEANDDIDKTMKSGKKRMLNNASYDLAQQCDYIKVLQSSRGAFQRMDACDELDETSFKRSSRLRVTDMVQQMNSSSISNLTDYNLKESDMDTKRYSKSTENISTQFSNAPFTRVPINQLGQRLKKGQEESYLNQLKKNSNSFSACGEDVKGQVHSVVADEIDYPCLETKPIGNSIKNEDLSREETITEKPEEIVEEKVNVMQNNSISSSEMITKDTVQVTMNGSNRWKKSYVDDRYPDNITQENELLNHRAKTQGTINDEVDKTKSSSSITLSSTTADKIVGDMLWRVIVEKKEPIMDEFAAKKAELKRERTMVTEETGERLGIGSDSPLVGSSGNNNRLEVRERSGNPAGAVAVDTNHRSSDRDKRHEEKATTVTTAAVQVCDEHDRHAIMSSTKARPSNNDSSTRFSRNVLTETSCVNNVKEERKKGGLGGFLQRFSRLRFSGRSKIPRSEVHKKSDGTSQQVDYGKVIVGKKQPDCIIIPLHPPEEEKQKAKLDESLENRTETAKDRIDVQRSSSNISANGRAPVSNKPPLPPQPPRVGTLSSRQSTAASSSSAVCSPRRRAATDLGNPSAIEMAKVRAMQAAQERTVGLLETDLDEAVSSTTTTTRVVAAASPETASGKKTRSLLNLNHSSTALRPRPEHALHVPQSPVAASHRSPRDDDAALTINQRPHKSMEFLLDKENLHFVKPPENELQKVGERVPSEHELRVQRSLQRLNVPDWYKNSPVARDGFRLKRHSDASQHGGWRTLGSKTTSLSSLSSSSHRQPTTGALLSPSPTPPVFSRWSTSLLNSAGSSPANSARSSFNHRQPYLGWRSQERLTNPRTPAERLAQGILPQLQAANKQQQQNQQQQHQVTTNQQLEVRNSIKEVTSAIVHYVQSGQEVGGGDRLSPRPRPEDWDDRGGARSTSPRGSVKLCWMESSFVGTRPVDSPETPMSLATETDCCPGCNAMASECCSCMDSATSGLFLDLTPTHDDSQQQESDGGCVSPSPSFEYHQQQPHPPSSSSSTHRHHHHHHHHHHQRQLRHQQQPQQQQQRHHRGSGQSDTDEAMATAALLRNKPSPGSTTLEDVLDSLLGLPSASRTPSPGPGPVVTSASMRHRTNVSQANAKAGKSCSDLRQDLQGRRTIVR